MAAEAPAQPPQQSGADPALMDWIVKEYLGTKIQRQHIMNQAGANMIYNHGMDVAQKLGVPTNGITPFPAPTSVTIQQPSQPPRSALNTWQQLGLGAAMLGAGAALGPLGSAAVGAIGQMLTGPQQPPVVAPVIPGKGDVGITIE